MNTKEFQSLLENRRSVYALNKELPLSKSEVVSIVEHAVKHSPSAFNSQSARVIVLFDEDHNQLWEETGKILKGIVGEDNFEGTKARIDGFKAAAGTVLFFEDQSVVEQLQKDFALYADNFPIWSEHSTAINQYATWLALSNENVGANLQHYNPLIDEVVANKWGAPKNWKLRAQLVFGGIDAKAGEKAFAELDGRVKVFGA